jgi:ketosteroid isomerase-like protein
MSSPSLDLVRSIYADWERGDFGSVEWAHPEIEFAIVGGPSPGTWKGLTGLRDGWRDFLDAWAEYRTSVGECRELDGERVLGLAHFNARGKGSGVEVGERLTKAAVLFHLRGGKVSRLVVYLDRDRALADLGLKE